MISPVLQVDLVLPCLDEAAALPWVLGRLPAGFRAIVVDNGSTDGSPELAAELGALVVREPRRGYGAAVLAGLATATAPYVAVMDCDGTLDPAEIPALVGLLVDGPTDLVCGRRRPLEPGVWPWHARVGNRLLASVLATGTGTSMHDIAPVRVARRAAITGLGITDERCGHPLQTLLLAARSGWQITEVDVSYRRRAAGSRSKISGTLRGTFMVVKDFSRVLIDDRRSRRAGRGAAHPGQGGPVPPLTTAPERSAAA